MGGFPDPVQSPALEGAYGLPAGTSFIGPPIQGTILAKTPGMGEYESKLLAYDGPWPPEENPKSPPPTAPSPPPPEVIHDRDDAIAVCTSPDVCKTLTPPVPYMVFGKGGDDQNYTGTVYSNGLIIKKADSQFTRTYGDQPGVGLGVKSGTVGDIVEPVTNSPIVRVEGMPVIRHRDTCTLNNGNCPGEYIHVQSTATHSPPDGNDEDDKTKGFLDSFGDQFMKDSGTAQDVKGVWNRLGDYWDDPSQIGSDIKGAYDSLPTGAEIWQGTKDIGSGIASGAADIWNDPGAAASAAGGWIKGQAVGAWDGTVEAWEEGGIGGVLGRAAAVAGEVVSPSNKARVVRRGAEVVDDIGDAQRARRLDGENNANEDGAPGMRSTRLHRVPCFDMPPGMDPAEYDRQLAEQMRTINNMTADDMAYAHWVLDKAGGTGALRQPGVQRAARRQYEADYRLSNPNFSEAQIAEHMGGLHATHWLDMVAGGNPASISGLGDGSVNSDIGNRWTGNGRADSLRQEAERMRNSGRANEKMNVELKRC